MSAWEGCGICVDTRKIKAFEKELMSRTACWVMYLLRKHGKERETVGTQHWDWIKKGLEWTEVGLDSVN